MADDDFIKIDVVGEERLIAALNAYPRKIGSVLRAAGKEAAKVILEQRGMQSYPPATSANRPPYPYYERGRGTWTSAARNTGKSENLGKKWYIRSANSYSTEIGNTASYAKYVHGDQQNRYLTVIGWRRLTDVVNDKMGSIVDIYNRWIAWALSKL